MRRESRHGWPVVVAFVMISWGCTILTGCRCDEERKPIEGVKVPDARSRRTDVLSPDRLAAERERLARAVTMRQRAEQMIEVGDYDGAVPLLRALEDTLPDDRVRLTLLTEALARSKPLATSRLKSGPEIPEALVYLHRLCLQHEVGCESLRKKPAIGALLERVPDLERVLDAPKRRVSRAKLDAAIKHERQIAAALHDTFGSPVLDFVVGTFGDGKHASVAFRFAGWPSVIYLAVRRVRGWQLYYVSHVYGTGRYTLALSKLDVGGERQVLWVRYAGYQSEYDGNVVHILVRTTPAPTVAGCLFTTRYREDPSGGENKRLPKRGAPGDVPIVGCVAGDWLAVPSSDTTGAMMTLPVETLRRPVLVVDIWKGGTFNAASGRPIQWESPRTVTYRFDGRRFLRAPLEREVREQRHKLAVERVTTARKGGRRALALLLEARALKPDDLQIQFELVRALQAANDKRLCPEIIRLLRLGGDRAKELVERDAGLAAACPSKK